MQKGYGTGSLLDEGMFYSIFWYTLIKITSSNMHILEI